MEAGLSLVGVLCGGSRIFYRVVVGDVFLLYAFIVRVFFW